MLLKYSTSSMSSWRYSSSHRKTSSSSTKKASSCCTILAKLHTICLMMLLLLSPPTTIRYFMSYGSTTSTPVQGLQLNRPKIGFRRRSTKRSYQVLEEHEQIPTNNGKNTIQITKSPAFLNNDTSTDSTINTAKDVLPFITPPPTANSMSSSENTAVQSNLFNKGKQQQRSRKNPRSLLSLLVSSSSTSKKTKTVDTTNTVKRSNKKVYKVSDVDELRRLILDEKVDLRQVILDDKSSITDGKKSKKKLSSTTASASAAVDAKRPTDSEGIPLFADIATEELLNHDVIELIAKRFHSKSMPGQRSSDDNAKLALALEGGGMRGCVTAGMAAAIASLGCWDAFDVVYGSSAGSVIGAYMVSRQMCMDVYVDILPAAKRKFVCKKRMMKSLAKRFIKYVLQELKPSSSYSRRYAKQASAAAAADIGTATTRKQKKTVPGMNISFVLDGIVGSDHGIRPLDMEMLQKNGENQPLRVAASCYDEATGSMYAHSFGPQDFFNTTSRTPDGRRSGLFACLEASMTVPGATGPPVQLIGDYQKQASSFYFDAFCFEPLPYRSAVEEGATHVLTLCSRPEGFEPKTKPGVYEQGIAPIYFKSHGHADVAEFFEKGGQQYIYAEDLLLLEKAKRMVWNKNKNDGQDHRVLVPPPDVLYGRSKTQQYRQPYHDSWLEYSTTNREEEWKRAHLFPLKVPKGTPELSTLEQDKDAVLAAVRAGFSAAYDLLVPAIGLNTEDKLGHLSGEDVAKLVFPDYVDDDEDVMTTANLMHSYYVDSKKEEKPEDLDSSQDDFIPMSPEEILQEKVFVVGDDIPRPKPMIAEEEAITNSTVMDYKEADEPTLAPALMINSTTTWNHYDPRQESSTRPTAFVSSSRSTTTSTTYHNNYRSELHMHAETLLMSLPGFQDGKLQHLSKGLRYHRRAPLSRQNAGNLQD